MSFGNVFFAERNNLLILKLVGDMRISHHTGLDRFAQEHIKQQAYESVLVDMSQTTYIDSTHLGLLVSIASPFRDKGGRGAACIIASPVVLEALQLIHLDVVFTIIPMTSLSSTNLAEIGPPHLKTNAETLRVILDAHQELTGLDVENETKFRNVIDVCKRELGGGEFGPVLGS